MNVTKKRWLALVAALLVVGALAVPAIAQDDATTTPTTVREAEPAESYDANETSLDGKRTDGSSDYDEPAEVNAETDALAAAFDAAGSSYEVVGDNGIRWIEWDFEDDPPRPTPRTCLRVRLRGPRTHRRCSRAQPS
jgi:hypothetical protein